VNAILAKLLAIFLASFIAGVGGCAGTFAGFRAIGAIKPKNNDKIAEMYKHMATNNVDKFGEDTVEER
jgi:hypothetical protein